MTAWLSVTQGDAPLLLSLPHTGTMIPAEFANDFVTPGLARRDTDWWIDRLYDFAAGLGATIVRTAISRSIIDVNRDPSGASLYPGQNTTGLCPVASFDGTPLYCPGHEPDTAAIAARRDKYFVPYHAALGAELARLRAAHDTVVLYDCHSIRSQIPLLFPGILPEFNIGSNDGASCAAALITAIETICDTTGRARVTDGRFKGGWITRHYGNPAKDVHAVQMELACRAYLREPAGAVDETNWPAPYDEDFAAPLRATLKSILRTCIEFAEGGAAE